MRLANLAAGLSAAMLFVAPAAAAPLEAYGGLPTIESIEISPDGTQVAVAMSSGKQWVVVVKGLPSGPAQTFSVGDAKVRRLDWLDGQKLIITTSQTTSITSLTGPRREYMLGYQLDLVTHKGKPLLDGPLGTGGTGSHMRGSNDNIGASLNVLMGPPEVFTIEGTPTLFLRGITFPDNYGVLTIFKVNSHGKPEVVVTGAQDTDDVVLGADGEPVARADYDRKAGRWILKMRQGGAWRVSRAVDAKIDPPFLLGLGRDGQSVVVGEPGETDLKLREVSADGKWGDPLPASSPDGVMFDPATHRLIGVHSLVGEEERYTFFDPKDQAAWNAVRSAFKGDRLKLESWSQDRKKIVVLADSPTLGPAYALVDMTTKQANWLGGRYQKLQPEDVSPVRPIRFKAKDGLELTGYLTTPAKAATARNLPLIVFPHGGPAARDEPGFDWWAQAMASRGYAVLQVNFRGSDGFGGAFLEAGFGEWGRKMQTDLSDGVRYLAGEGLIDPKRVCIVGASYGGYAALGGAALDPGVYRCAVSVAGLSDLGRFVSWSKTQNGVTAQRYWTRFMGAEAARDAALDQISPAAHVDRVDIPVLLIHGRDDTVVPLEQSRIMADALKKAGKPVELVVQPGADHWLSRGETRLQTLEATMAFVEKHNPPN